MDALEFYLEDAGQSLDDGDPEGALEAVRAALALAPDRVEAWYLRGLGLMDIGERASARRSLERALSLDGGHAGAAFALADLLLYEYASPPPTLLICDTFLREDLQDELYADFLNLKAAALCELGNFEQALEVYERAGELCPHRRDTGGIGWCLFETCCFEEAKAALLEAVRGLGRDNPATHFYLAITLERVGEQRLARKHFRIAARLDPELYDVPQRIPEETFAKLVERAVEGLTPPVRERLDNVAVAVESWPSLDELRESSLSPLIVGCFHGASLRDRSTEDPWTLMPPQIAIYQRNLEYTCRSKLEIVDQIRVTLWHEVGHFLGLSEEDLHERGLE